MAEDERKTPEEARPTEEKKGRDVEYVWPALVFKEYLALIFVTMVLIAWSLLANAPLKEIANPGITENPAKAPWYFRGLQELLVYFDPWFAGVVLPTLIIVGLMVIPYIDRNPQGSGGYAFSVRKFAILNFLFGFALWWILIGIGSYLRGPNWAFYWPWESWAIPKEIEETLIDIAAPWGLVLLGSYFFLGMILPWIFARNFFGRVGIIRYLIVMAFLLLMYLVPIKMVLRLAFNIKYVLMTPWFNI